MKKLLQRIHAFGYIAISIAFLVAAFALVVMGGVEMWPALNPRSGLQLTARFSAVLEAIGLLTIAVAALELSQTIVEEEVLREAHMSAPTRVRRFLSRFMIVVVVSLAIEFLVGVFELLHSDPSRLPHVAAVGAATALLLVAWGIFIRLNVSAELLEPQAMESAKREDKKVE